VIYDQKPWLESYDSCVRAEVEIPDISLHDLLVETLTEMRAEPALYYVGIEMTFGELLEKSGQFARGLQEEGYGAGDVVAICLPNVPQYHIALVGALRAGCAISGLAPLLMPSEMAHQLSDSDAKILVIDDAVFDGKYLPVADRAPEIATVLVTGPADTLPTTGEYPAGAPIIGKNVSSFMDFLSQYSAEPASVTSNPNDQCFLQYTGGTTGPPKGAVLTHRNMVSNATVFKHYMKFEPGQGTWVTAFPMFHMAGLATATFAMAYGYCQGVLPDPRNLEAVVEMLDQLRPFYVANVPSLAFLLLEDEGFRQLDFSNLKFWVSGASPFPVDGIKALERIIGDGKVVEVWGMTETSPLVTVNPARGEKKAGSVGLPLPNTEVRVLDLNDGESEVPLGSEGELVVSGPQVMAGYRNRPEETEHALRDHDGRVFMHTGDVGRMDHDGYVYVVDRLKDMIIVSGYKVFSAEVEDKFHQHPAVATCAVIGLPNPQRPGSEIVELIVQKTEAYRLTPDDEVEKELIAFAKRELAPYKVPRTIEFIEALPMTSVGKIDKKMLRARAADAHRQDKLRLGGVA
jgi:long-chain acyl-CoA synthetase